MANTAIATAGFSQQLQLSVRRSFCKQTTKDSLIFQSLLGSAEKSVLQQGHITLMLH